METINLWENEIPFLNEEYQKNENNAGTPSITAHIIDDDKIHSAVVICPGGGYSHRAKHEGGSIAQWLNSKDINAFVVNYRVNPYTYPVPVCDVKRALRFIRHNAERFNINPRKMGLIGFSAGAHLAGLSVLDKNEYKHNDDIDSEKIDLYMMTLCYPVVSLCGNYSHRNSGIMLLGDKYEYYKENLSLERNIVPNMPPIFIWHTFDDKSVSVKNSLKLADALKKNGNKFELHIFSEGRHGLGLAKNAEGADQWRELYINWLKKINFINH